MCVCVCGNNATNAADDSNSRRLEPVFRPWVLILFFIATSRYSSSSSMKQFFRLWAARQRPHFVPLAQFLLVANRVTKSSFLSLFFFRYFRLEGIVDLSAAERKPQPKDVNSLFLSIEMDITTQFDRIHTIFFICFAYHVLFLLHFGRRFGRCDVITVRSATRNSGGRTSREPTRLTTRVRT